MRTIVATVIWLLVLASPTLTGAEDEVLQAPSSQALAPVPGEVIEHFTLPDEPWSAGNRGLKLSAGPGEVVVASLPATVVFTGEVAGDGWVTLDHGGGLTTTYGVLDPAVGAGARVRTGQRLGSVSDSTDHLHWGAKLDGVYIDPASLLRAWGVRLVPVER